MGNPAQKEEGGKLRAGRGSQGKPGGEGEARKDGGSKVGRWGKGGVKQGGGGEAKKKEGGTCDKLVYANN